MKLLARFNHLLFPLLLVLLTGTIAALNYTPGSFLTGWDTLHPEFNFFQNLKNVFFGVFRSDQGLGAIAAHSHMAELPRILILWVLSFIFDTSFIRYAFFFLCLILGPLGIFYFAKSIVKSDKYPLIPSLAAFLAALYYLFNLGTVQHFYVPFEMFAVQYAALGFLFLFAKNYLATSSRKALTIFAIISFFAAPMAYAALLWYAYFAGMLSFIGMNFLLNKSKDLFKRSIILIAFILMTNAFWILPNLFFLKTAAHEVPHAQSNKLFSEEAFLHNKQYGTVQDTALYRNYLFNWRTVETSEFAENPGALLHAWHDHLNNPFITLFGYSVFVASLVGIFFAIKTKNKYAISLLPAGIIAFIMIINMNPPFEFFFSYLRDNISLFKEGLRFPFTKFSILLMFTLSIYFAVFWNSVLTKIADKTPWKNHLGIPVLVTALMFVLYGIYGLPMFRGELIYPNLRITIPQSYFDLYEWMDNKPADARIAPLPIHSLWGWEYYDWGFQGAGFTWFGLSQPFLARDFDRWNASNEQYYREMSTALYARDTAAVENIARKYHIHYFLLDESVISPGSRPNALWIRETKDTFDRSAHIQLEKQFGEISLYSVSLPEKTNSFLYAPSQFTTVGPELVGGYRDQASQDYPVYIPAETPSVLYPARSLIDRYGKINKNNINYISEDQVILSFDNAITDEYSISPDWLSDSIYPDTLKEQEDKLEQEFQSTLYKIDSTLFVALPIASQNHQISTEMRQNFDCSHPRTTRQRITVENESMTLFSQGGETCAYMVFPNQNLDLGQLIIVQAEHVTGIPLRICITENISRKCDVYTALEKGEHNNTYYYVVPPFPTGLDGYVVHFNNVSIGNTPSINTIHSVQAVTLPYYRIQNVKLTRNQQPSSITNNLTLDNINSLNPVTAQFTTSDKGLLVLTKSYGPGWKVYSLDHGLLTTILPFIFGTEIPTHTQVNSWANGWMIDSTLNDTYLLVYLPQYFQYAGITLAVGSLLVLLVYLSSARSKS